MSSDFSIFDVLDETPYRRAQADYFRAEALIDTFQAKIALSQAAGKDGIRSGRFSQIIREEVALIERKVFDGSYNFTTYKERLISRGSDRNPRQISIPTIRDRLLLRSLCELIHENVNGSVNHTPHSIVNSAVKALRRCPGGYSFVRVDVKDFYPSLNHRMLARELAIAGLEPLAVNLCMKAACTPTGNSREPPERGIPQGLSISNALAQIYMKRFDENQIMLQYDYFRYVDDILCLVPSIDAERELKRLTRSLNRRGLRAHPAGKAGKTEIIPVDQGVDFLGYRIEIGRVSIRKSSYDKMFRRALEILTDYKYTKNIDRLIYRLNLRITGCILGDKKRGWMFFFSRTENLSQLKNLDYFILKKAREIGVPQDYIRAIKTFVKSYYEIRFNLSSTVYIPNFNNFDENDKINAIVCLTRFGREVVSTWDVHLIEETFKRAIAKEVMDLEQDIGGIS